jgi:hypothetical protein
MGFIANPMMLAADVENGRLDGLPLAPDAQPAAPTAANISV